MDKVSERPMDFNVMEFEKFTAMISEFTFTYLFIFISHFLPFIIKIFTIHIRLPVSQGLC